MFIIIQKLTSNHRLQKYRITLSHVFYCCLKIQYSTLRCKIVLNLDHFVQKGPNSDPSTTKSDHLATLHYLNTTGSDKRNIVYCRTYILQYGPLESTTTSCQGGITNSLPFNSKLSMWMSFQEWTAMAYSPRSFSNTLAYSLCLVPWLMYPFLMYPTTCLTVHSRLW